MKIYKTQDLQSQEVARLINNAKILVRRDIEDLKIQDQGTCVVGGGIQIEFLPPKCRIPRRIIVVDGPFQGNVSNKKALANALKYLQDNGVCCRYYDGVID